MYAFILPCPEFPFFSQVILKTARLKFVDNPLPSSLTVPRRQGGNEEGARCEPILKF